MSETSKILIIDDSPSARLILRDTLEPAGYNVRTANSGEEGLDLAKREPPDLILLDVVMPGMTGLEVCKIIRDTPSISDVPVLFLTSLEDRETKLLGIEAGADDFITKPFDSAEMLLRVNTITKLNRYQRINAERERVAWLIEESEAGLLLVDADDGITFANAKARLFLGLPEDESEASSLLQQYTFLELAKKCFHLEPEESWSTWPDLATKHNTGERKLYLVRPESDNATATWLEVKVQDETDKQRQRLIRLQDISSRVNDQRDIWTFQSMITHKLRTPLSGIVFSLDILASSAEGMSGEDVQQMSAMGLENAQRLNGEIEEILQFLEAPATEDTDNLFPVAEIDALVKKIAKDLEIEPVVSGQRFSASKRCLALNERAMETILWKLLENAKKFHPENAPQVTIDLTPAHTNDHVHALHLCLMDNGTSLSPKQIANAWVPYYQGEKHITFELDGMGLGLPVVASLVWSVGGSCKLGNRPDTNGVAVELTIPLSTQT